MKTKQESTNIFTDLGIQVLLLHHGQIHIEIAVSKIYNFKSIKDDNLLIGGVRLFSIHMPLSGPCEFTSSAQRFSRDGLLSLNKSSIHLILNSRILNSSSSLLSLGRFSFGCN